MEYCSEFFIRRSLSLNAMSLFKIAVSHSLLQFLPFFTVPKLFYMMLSLFLLSLDQTWKGVSNKCFWNISRYLTQEPFPNFMSFSKLLCLILYCYVHTFHHPKIVVHDAFFVSTCPRSNCTPENFLYKKL